MPQTGTVLPQGLNLRQTPGGTVIRVLPQGGSVEILEDQGEFLKVDASGQTGFVAARFIQRETGADAGTGAGSAGAGATSAASNAGALNLDGLAGKVPAGVIAQIPQTAQDFSITTNLRLAHFLAQCALESNNFVATVENLNYRAARLMEVFPKYFRGVDTAPYANNPQKIGNRVYANRMGNGNEASGDGFRFRGRGYIQLTGKTNYTSFSNFVGEDCVANPDLVATKYPLASAAFYFSSNNIWAICDRGAGDDTVTQVTKAVNGGTHGLPQRLQNFKVFISALR